MTCTNKQIGKLMKLKKTHGQEVAGLKVGVTRKTAGKYIREGKLPGELKQQRDWLTRSDCFHDVWPTLAAMLANAPGLEAKTLLEWLIEQKDYTPPFHFGQLRTLQRRVRDWRALHGPSRSHSSLSPFVLGGLRKIFSHCFTCFSMKTWLNPGYFTL